MNTIKSLTFTAMAIFAVAMLFQPPITQAGEQRSKCDHRRLRLSFQKCVPEGGDGSLLTGNVTGDLGAGTIAFTYYATDFTDLPIVRFAGEYIIETTPGNTITTVCAGFADTRNGQVVLNGVVTAGSYLGDQVEVRAKANETFTCSSGQMTIIPIKR